MIKTIKTLVTLDPPAQWSIETIGDLSTKHLMKINEDSDTDIGEKWTNCSAMKCLLDILVFNFGSMEDFSTNESGLVGGATIYHNITIYIYI